MVGNERWRQRNSADRPPEARLAAPHPFRQCRPRHLSRPHQSFRLGRDGARSAARTFAARRLDAAGPRSRRREEALAELELAQRFGARFVGIGEPDYPSALRQIDGAPPLIAVKGDAAACASRPSAWSASATASICRRQVRRHAGARIGRAGYSVVSGFARGIDIGCPSRQPRHRHDRRVGWRARQALSAGKRTACSKKFERQRPVLSAKCPSAGSRAPSDFPRRNRLIAGIGLGLVVIEAAARSGSLITARYAGKFRPPGVCRARLAARSALGRRQRADQGRRLDRHQCRRCHRGHGAAQPQFDLFSPQRGRGADYDDDKPMALPPSESERDLHRRCARADAGRNRRHHPPHRLAGINRSISYFWSSILPAGFTAIRAAWFRFPT